MAADRARAQRNREMQEEEDRKHDLLNEEFRQRDLRQLELEKQKRNKEDNGNGEQTFLLGQNIKVDPIEMVIREQKFLAQKKYQDDLAAQV